MEETCRNLQRHIEFCNQMRNELRRDGHSMVQEARILSRFQVTDLHLQPILDEIEAGKLCVLESSKMLRDRGYLVASTILQQRSQQKINTKSGNDV